jgi:hypothetical protein
LGSESHAVRTARFELKKTGRQAENYTFSFKLYSTPVRKSMHYLIFFIDLMFYFVKKRKKGMKKPPPVAETEAAAC